MTPTEQHWIVTLLVGILGGGGIKYIYDGFTDWLQHRREAPTPEDEERARQDHSMLAMARSREMLVEDNTRLRSELSEEREQRRIEKAEWTREREQLKQEIAELEAQVRAQREEFNLRVDAMLQRIHDLQGRTANMDG